MTRLHELRKRLSRLRRRRQRIRRATAACGLVLAVLWILAVAILIDWLFELSQLQRLVSLVLCIAVGLWALRRWSLPWLGHRESELDMALMVQREHRIDSDLVAALEFESPGASAWGSLLLERAVIDHVAAESKQLNVMRGLSRRPLHRRAGLVAVTAVIWLVAALLFPQHVRVFLQRFALGSAHYPTQTVIASIEVNGRGVDPANPARSRIKVYHGQAARFEVTCAGKLPAEAGRVELRTVQNGLRTSLNLEPGAKEEGVYRGEWPRLVEPVDFQVFVGDAWTDPARLEVTAAPVIEVGLEVIPPDYAKKDGPVRMPAGLRQISVVEGSRVIVKLSSDKWLEGATLSAEDHAYPFQQAKTDQPEQHDAWVLDGDDTPLAAVVQPVRFAIQVTDADGQQLERPIEGVIRLQADAPPRVAAATATRYVLPTATPEIYYRAIDDYGIARVTMLCEVTRADGRTEPAAKNETDAIAKHEIEVYALAAGAPPLRNVENKFAMDLAPLKLVKGDTLKVTVRAVDFRGRLEGKSALAEPLVFQVTDLEGILSNMMEFDQRSAQQLQSMIERQLGIGGAQ